MSDKHANVALWRALTTPHMQLTRPMAVPGAAVLWWGAIIAVQPGDRVRYFVTPWGMALEAVISATDVARRW